MAHIQEHWKFKNTFFNFILSSAARWGLATCFFGCTTNTHICQLYLDKTHELKVKIIYDNPGTCVGPGSRDQKLIVKSRKTPVGESSVINSQLGKEGCRWLQLEYKVLGHNRRQSKKKAVFQLHKFSLLGMQGVFCFLTCL